MSVRGGQAQFEVTVTNNGTTAATPLALTVALPTGVTFVESLGSGWTCTAAPSLACSLPTLASGAASSFDIVADVAASFTGALTIAPTVSTPSGASVTSSPLSIQLADVAGVLRQEFAKGSIEAIGNTVITCVDSDPDCANARVGIGASIDRGSFVMQNLLTTGVGSINSSQGTLSVSGVVSRAYLTWGGDVDQAGVDAPNAALNNTVVFAGPDNVSHTVVGQVSAIDIGGGDVSSYVAWAEVTSLVTGSGSYTVGDIQTSLGRGSYGGWSLVVINRDAALPRRVLTVAAPVAFIGPSATYTQSLATSVELGGAAASVTVAAFQGDRSVSQDTIKVNDVTLGATNPFAGRILGTRNPTFENNFGVDVVQRTTTPLTGSGFDLEIRSPNDRVTLAIIGIALDLPE